MSNKEFEKLLKPLQVELVKLQEWVTTTGAKVCLLFERRDTAGKGGMIKLITERTSPRPRQPPQRRPKHRRIAPCSANTSC